LAKSIFQSDNNSSADDADKADLRGFLSRLRRDGKIAPKAQSHQENIFDSTDFVSSCLGGQKLLPQAKENPRKSALSASSALLLLSLWPLIT
jgi:hypothetical protein